jgi:hypothetical protein
MRQRSPIEIECISFRVVQKKGTETTSFGLEDSGGDERRNIGQHREQAIQLKSKLEIGRVYLNHLNHSVVSIPTENIMQIDR